MNKQNTTMRTTSLRRAVLDHTFQILGAIIVDFFCEGTASKEDALLSDLQIKPKAVSFEKYRLKGIQANAERTILA